MSSVQLQQIRDIFEQCVEMPTHEQTEFLHQACIDDGPLKEEVQQLLRGHEVAESTGFMKWPELGDNQTVINHSADHRFPPGESIGPYEVIEQIGAGGTGTVYRAKKRGPDSTIVAIKVLLPWLRSDEGLARFEIEKRALAGLDHSGIARILDDGVCSDGSPYLVMEFVEGKQLDILLTSDGMPIRQRIVCFQEICNAVATAHEHQILHRDLKPANIIIKTDGKPVITDFGLAKFLKPNLTDTNLTTTGRVMGTPKFMAPEQAAGISNLGMTTDVYGLGTVLYFMLTDRPPFDGKSIINIGSAIQNDLPTNPRSINRGTSRDLETICLKCLNKRPDDRYRTVSELSKDIGNFLDGQPISAQRRSASQQLFDWAKRNPMMSILSGSIVVLLVVGLAVSSFLWQRSQQQKKLLLAIIHQNSQNVKSSSDEPETLALRAEILRSNTESYNQLEKIGGLDIETRYAAAVAYFNLGRVEQHLGNMDNCKIAFLNAESRFRLLSIQHPTNLRYRFDIYHCLIRQRRHDEAFPLIQLVVEEDHTGNLDFLAALGNAYHWQAKGLFKRSMYVESEAMSTLGVEFARAHFGGNGSASPYRRQIAEHKAMRSRSRWMLGDKRVAINDLREATALTESLSEEYPTNEGLLTDFCIDLVQLGSIYLHEDNPVAAQSVIEKAELISKTFINRFGIYAAPWIWQREILELKWIYACKYQPDSEKQDAARDLLECMNEFSIRFPQRVRVKIQLAYFLTHPANESRDTKRAEELINEVNSTDPQLVNSSRMAIVLFRLGRLEEAKRRFEAISISWSPFFRHYSDAIEALSGNSPTDDPTVWLPNIEVTSLSIGHEYWYSYEFGVSNFEQEYWSVEKLVQNR